MAFRGALPADVPQTNSIVHCILNLSISQKGIAFGLVDEACVATCDFFKLGLDGSAPSIKRPVQLTAYYSLTHMHKDSSENVSRLLIFLLYFYLTECEFSVEKYNFIQPGFESNNKNSIFS